MCMSACYLPMIFVHFACFANPSPPLTKQGQQPNVMTVPSLMLSFFVEWKKKRQNIAQTLQKFGLLSSLWLRIHEQNYSLSLIHIISGNRRAVAYQWQQTALNKGTRSNRRPAYQWAPIKANARDLEETDETARSVPKTHKWQQNFFII